MSHIELFGKIKEKVYFVRNSKGDAFKISYNGEKVERFPAYDLNFYFLNQTPIMPTLDNGSNFCKFEKFHEYDSDSFEVNTGEFILEERMKIEAEVEKVVRKTNGDIQCYLDFVYRTEESPEAEKCAKEFFEKEKAKYEIEIGPERDKVIDDILNELNNLGNTEKSEDSVVKEKKWYEFWKTQ